METTTNGHNWRNLSAAEYETLLPWMKFVHRNNMSMVNSVLITFGILWIVLIIMSFVEVGLRGFLDIAWANIIFAVVMVFAGLLAADYRRIMKAFIKGDCQALEVEVLGKVIGPARRTHYYAIQMSGSNRDLRVYKKIYNNVCVSDTGYLIRFNTPVFMKILVERKTFLPSCPYEGK